MEKDWYRGPKETQVFNKFTRLNKIKTVLIASVILLVGLTGIYFFAKSLMTYTIDIVTNGGLVYGQEYVPQKYHFMEKTKYPTGLKKEGYYIEGFYEDKNFTIRYQFGRSIWRSKKLYVKWEDGFAVRLHYADGQEDKTSVGDKFDDTTYTEEKLKIFHEQYVKPGSEYTLPEVFNDTEDSKHYGEQLLWYDNPDCTGDFFDIKSYVVDKNLDIYGRWFDTDETKFLVDDSGTLLQYRGWCENVKLPEKVKKIKDIEPSNFTSAYWDETKVVDGSNYSVFSRVIGSLTDIYIPATCTDIGTCAFRSCKSLQRVIFENGVTLDSIGECAFMDCTSLSSISIPTTVKVIGDKAFYGTSAMRTISGLDSVVTVGDSAFQGSGVYALNFPELSLIGGSAFAGCYYLHTLVLGSPIMAKANVTDTSDNVDTNDNILFGSPSAKMYVPNKLLTEYKKAYPSYASRIFAIEDMEA